MSETATACGVSPNPSHENQENMNPHHEKVAERDFGHPLASSQDEATYWRNMFEALRKERLTNPEKQLQATLQENSRRDEALRTLVRHLEKEKQRHQNRAEVAEKNLKQLNEIQKQKKSSSSADLAAAASQENDAVETGKRKQLEENLETERGQVRRLQEKVKQQAKLLEVYEIMTSTQISETACRDAVAAAQTSRGTSFDCRVINYDEKIESQFRLSYIQSREVNDTPSSYRKKAIPPIMEGEMKCEPLGNPQYLPEFMQDPEPIEFERSECAVLLKNVLITMFKEDDQEEEQSEN